MESLHLCAKAMRRNRRILPTLSYYRQSDTL
nr:MAG TPA: hypothetical protein [Microviridae sp.]